MNHINFKNHLNTFHSVQSIEKDKYLNTFIHRRILSKVHTNSIELDTLKEYLERRFLHNLAQRRKSNFSNS